MWEKYVWNFRIRSSNQIKEKGIQESQETPKETIKKSFFLKYIWWDLGYHAEAESQIDEPKTGFFKDKRTRYTFRNIYNDYCIEYFGIIDEEHKKS